MGDYADMSWDDTDPESWFDATPRYGRRSRPFRYRALKREQRTNQTVFAAFIDKPIDPSQF